MAVEPTTKYQKRNEKVIFDVDWSTNPTGIIGFGYFSNNCCRNDYRIKSQATRVDSS